MIIITNKEITLRNLIQNNMPYGWGIEKETK